MKKDDNGFWMGHDSVELEHNATSISSLRHYAECGNNLRRAILASEIIPVDATTVIEWDSPEARSLFWRLWGVSSERRSYSGVKVCNVDWLGDQVTFSPTKRRHGGWFEAFPDAWKKGHEDIVVHCDLSDEGLGIALEACLKRCI